MLFRLLLLLVSLPLLALGGEGLFYFFMNPQQTAMSCEEFVRNRPRTAWLRLTACEIDYIGAGFSESPDGRVTELFFPVRAVGQRRDTPAVIVAATRDTAALTVAQQTIGGGRQPDQEQFLVMMLTIVTQLKASREIHGYARRGLIEVLRARQVLAGLSAPLDAAFVMIDLYARPSPLIPGIEAGAGLLGVIAFFVLRSRRRRRRVPAAPAGTAVVLPDEPPAVAPATLSPSQRIRGLMLLNLPADATAADVEFAPPLGTRREVLDRLGELMPGIRFDPRGRCLFSRPDHALALDIGPGDPIATAVIDAEGEGAVAAVRSLLTSTGWRAFAPRLGRFVGPDEVG